LGHLLVTNDFPPKIGGIQSYLYELWRRLPPEEVTVLTTAYQGADSFDAGQSFRIVRSKSPVLLPHPRLGAQIKTLAREVSAGLVVFDPAFPLGLIAPRLGLDYAVVVHGSEVTIPGRVPVTRPLLGEVLSAARLVIAAGEYPAAEARNAARGGTPAIVVIPPGVDTEIFHPLSQAEKSIARERLGLPAEGLLVASVSRLVPRKGMDVLIEAVGLLKASMPDICLAVAGEGRELQSLQAVARRSGVGVHFLGRVSEEDKALLNGAADVWAMLCRDRMSGLLQEGFGIVFMEAAACGVPQVAGDSGGAGDAVADGETGYVVRNPADPAAAAAALRRLLDSAKLRNRLGRAARQRAVDEFDYAVLAPRLRTALREAGG
jgi:phosphatidylinositol alpha-1,6-mannosyltransferase